MTALYGLFQSYLPAEKIHSGLFSAIKVHYGTGSAPWGCFSVVGVVLVSSFGCTPKPYLLIKFLRI